MTRATFDGKLFIVSHYQEPLGSGNELKNTSSKPGSPKTELQPEAKPAEAEPKGILSSSSSRSLSRTSTNAPTPIQYPTPPASTFKQVKWLDSPTVKTPISRSQTPGGHNEDSDTEYITSSTSASSTNNIHSSKSILTTASTNLKTPAPRHTVTHHWQEHILLEDPFPRRRWPPGPGPGRHGNDRAHTRSMPEGGGGDDYYEKAELWHISAKELEMSLEKYEREGRRSARRKRRTQSVYLPIPEYDDNEDEEDDYEWGHEEDRNYTFTSTSNNNEKDRIHVMKVADKSALPFRRWSDVHRLAAEVERSPSTTSEATELGRFGRLGVGK